MWGSVVCVSGVGVSAVIGTSDNGLFICLVLTTKIWKWRHSCVAAVQLDPRAAYSRETINDQLNNLYKLNIDLKKYKNSTD